MRHKFAPHRILKIGRRAS
ncbi:hypothetical protein DND36_28325, partial [Pseudomonas savastanoi pv. glycinea]